MKKSLYIALLCIATVVAILIGSAIHIGVPIVNWVMSIVDDDVEIESDGSNKFFKGATTYQQLDDFSNISIDCHVADIDIVTGEEYSISYKSSHKELLPQFDVKEGGLSVIQPDYKDKKWKGLQSTNCKITISIPEGAKIDTCDLTCNVGDIDFKNVEITDLTLDVNVGDVDVTNTHFENFTGTVNVGDFDIDSAEDLSHYDFNLSCSVGDISVGDKDYRNNYNAKGDGSGSITVQVNTGDLDIEYK